MSASSVKQSNTPRWNTQPKVARLKPEQLYMFTVYLDTMIRCGISLLPCLEVLSRGGDLRLCNCAEQLARDVEAGMRFSMALSRQPATFSSSYVRIMQTAEATGKMGECLRRLAVTLNRQNDTSRRLFGALFYPAFLVVASALLVGAMVYFVFPMIIKVTQDAGVDPPALTRNLMTLAQPKVLIIGLSTLLVSGLAFVHIVRHRTWGPVLRRILEAYTPPGRFYVRVLLLRCARQLALLLDSGVDMMRALTYAASMGEGSVLLSEAFEDVLLKTRSGETLADSFASHSVFPSMLSAMVSVSDMAGDTQRMLNQFCDVLEDQLNNELSTVTSLLEPMMLALMGVVIGVILLAAFMPIYDLAKF